MGNLSTPNSVQKLQMALHAKAKAEAGYRFYALYDKISREDILAHAWAQCRSNKGAPGVDGQDFADVEAYGVQRWLGELALALRNEEYRPDPIRRVFIPKANGKLRPLGISTLRDRVCMTAAMLVLEPIFEADLPDEQYAYRPGRNAQQAVIDVEETLFRGHPEVVDADLADYFGSIPHAELMLSLARRIVDRRVLHLIKVWLECAVEESDDRGRKMRTTEAKDNGRGIPIDPHPKFPGKSALEVILCTLHAGGKFGGKAYQTSGGLHGVGASVVNALSDVMRVEVARNKELFVQHYARGAAQGPLQKVGAAPNRRGTTVTFHPDGQIFGSHQFKPARLMKMARSKRVICRLSIWSACCLSTCSRTITCLIPSRRCSVICIPHF